MVKPPKPEQKKRPKLPQEYEDALKAHVDKLIYGNKLVMFCTSWCPYGHLAEKQLKKHGIEFTRINLNTYCEMEGEYEMLGPLLHKYIVERTGLKTVPNMMIKDYLIGGNGSLTKKLNTSESKDFKIMLDKYQVPHNMKW